MTPPHNSTTALPLPSERALRDLRGLPRGGALQWLLEGPGFTTALMPAVDLVGLVAGIVLAARTGTEHRWTLLLLPPVALAVFVARGLYRRRMRTLVLDVMGAVLAGVTIAAMAVVLADVYLAGARTDGAVLATAWGVALAGVGAGRTTVAIAQRAARARGLVGRTVLVVGAGHVGRQVVRRLRTHPQYGLRAVGFLDELRRSDVDADGQRLPVLGSFADLRAVAGATGAEHVIIAFSTTRDNALVHLVRECDELGLEVSLVPRMFDAINDRVAYETLGGLPLLGLRAVDPKGWQFAVKHAFDRVAAALMLVSLAPLLAIVAAAVRLESPGPVLFRQRRVGRDGTVFDLVKFRSMRTPSEPVVFRPSVGRAPGGVEGEDRRTRVGTFLRRTSLDELPQLLNVLRGEMSLVGPRPERPEFVELFGRDIARYGDRHRVKSGLTGWAQVHGLRGQTSLADRVEWDNYYIAHWSLALDCKILLLTLLAILRPSE